MSKNKKIGRRTVGRILAIQTLYQYNFHNKKLSFETILKDTINHYIKEECENNINYNEAVNTDLSRILINGSEDKKEEINQIIKENLYKANFDEISEMVKIILRLGVFELQNMKETSEKIIINEYVNLTSYFGEEKFISLVNGVLDKISKQIKK
jgi:N utilization substance protein B